MQQRVDAAVESVAAGFGRATIFALSSGAPPAGIAVLRVSGPAVQFGLETLAGGVPEPRVASLRTFRHPITREPIDKGLVLFFPAPGSLTGEDVAEFHLHGGRAMVAAALDALALLPGARMAEAGEFTRRAFEAGRLDLTEAEGLADLVAAETEQQRRLALAQANGGLRGAYEGWRETLIRALAEIEAELDFAGEDETVGGWQSARAVVAGLAAEVRAALASVAGERVRDGAEIVILGAPNVGKSSLLNAIARRDVAIVSPVPGTTRDLIEVRLDLAGFPVRLVDTAGLRDAADGVEREGVARARARAAGADLVLWLTDHPGQVEVQGTGGPVIRVATKADAMDSDTERWAEHKADHVISALTGQGIERLLGDIGRRLRSLLPAPEAALVTRARHRGELETVAAALDAALALGLPLELAAEELRVAATALGRVTGRIDAEAVLDSLFRQFCIGK